MSLAGSFVSQISLKKKNTRSVGYVCNRAEQNTMFQSMTPVRLKWVNKHIYSLLPLMCRTTSHLNRFGVPVVHNTNKSPQHNTTHRTNLIVLCSFCCVVACFYCVVLIPLCCSLFPLCCANCVVLCTTGPP